MRVAPMACSPVVTVSQESTVMEALRVMRATEVTSVAVVQNSKLVGIFTIRDLARGIAEDTLKVEETRVGDTMTPYVIRTDGRTSIGRAAEIMLQHHIHHLPIVNEQGEPEGMVSLHDLLQSTIDDLAHEVNRLDAYISCDGPGG